MAWGSSIETVVQESTSTWGPRTTIIDDVHKRQYIVNARTAEWGHSKTSGDARVLEIYTTPGNYTDVQLQRVGASDQYWVVNVETTWTWQNDPLWAE